MTGLLLVVGSLLALGGGLAVVVIDLTMAGRRRTGRARDLAEVVGPFVGLVVLVAAVWRTAPGW
ncbi:MAG TPA: hypothetical protein ENK55_05850 [Actinobacteria bacterium]|nr:hypothetical protein [Actinomycetota bacterium]